MQGLNTQIEDAPGGGRRINATGGAGLASGALVLPFSVILQRKSDGTWQRGVVFNSLLYNQLTIDTKITITGLLTQVTPTPDDAGWADTMDGDKVWLECEIGTWPAIASASIRSLGAEDEFGGGTIQHNDGTGSPPVYTQTFARVVLAEIVTAGSALAVVKLISTHRRIATTPALSAKNADGDNSQPVAAVWPFAI